MRAMIKREIETEVTTRFQTIIFEQIDIVIKDKLSAHFDTQIAIQMTEFNARLDSMMKNEFKELIGS